MKPHLKELCFCRTPRPSAAYPGSPSWTCPGSLACTPRSSSPRREWPPAASCMDRRVGVGSNLIGAISWWDMDSYTVQKKKKKEYFFVGEAKKTNLSKNNFKISIIDIMCGENTFVPNEVCGGGVFFFCYSWKRVKAFSHSKNTKHFVELPNLNFVALKSAFPFFFKQYVWVSVKTFFKVSHFG